MPPYTNVTTNTTYILNTKKMNFSQAESYCNDNGGHLASWNNREEQMEVEQYFIKVGVLFPNCHQIYWMGLRAKSWPRFNWLDSLLLPPGEPAVHHGCRAIASVSPSHAAACADSAL
jgi:hypothetical protein